MANITMLAPAPNMRFATLPSGSTYISDANGLIQITNGSIVDQIALVNAGCVTLNPVPGGGFNVQGGTAYTLQPSDNGNMLLFTSSSAVTCTLPATLPQGFFCKAFQAGTGALTVAAGAGANVVSPLSLFTSPAQYFEFDCSVISQNGGNTAAGWDAIIQPTPGVGTGIIGAQTLALLYSQDTTNHYTQYTTANVYADGTPSNDGTWLKTGTGNGSGNWTQVSTLTLASVSAAEVVTAANLVLETTRATTEETVLAAQTQTAFVWGDDGFYAWGVWDTSGYPVFALRQTDNRIIGSAADVLNGSYVWGDEGLAAGSTVIVDTSGNIMPPAGAAPGIWDAYTPYVGGDGNVYATNNAPLTQSPVNICLGGARGAVRSAPQGKNWSVHWIDDGTGLGDAMPSKRRFDLRGGTYLASLGTVQKLILIVDTGHSLTVGGHSGAVLTTAPPYAQCAMFTGGPKVVQPTSGGVTRSSPAPLMDDSELAGMAEFYEYQWNSDQGESHGGGVATWCGTLGNTYGIVFASAGCGGATLANLLSGTNQFYNLQRVVERSAALAALNNWQFECWVLCSIGENDYATYASNASGFQTNLIALQASVQTMVQNARTRNGFSSPTNVPLLCQQPSSWTVSSLATCALVPVFVALAISNPNQFVLFGPGYYTDNYLSASLHKTDVGYKLDGEYMGRTVLKVRASVTPLALYATGVSNSGNTLTITTSAQSTLAIDTSVVSDPGQYGLRVLDVTSSNTPIALSGISVSGTSITATLASHVAGHTLMLGVADIGTSGNNAGPTTGPRCCIRDSATDVSSADTGSTPMYNYMCHQELNWTAAA